MIRPDQIPDEVVEPLAIAIAGGLLMWAHALPVQRKIRRKEARAAIAAALSAWPGVEESMGDEAFPPGFFLPLPHKERR